MKKLAWTIFIICFLLMRPYVMQANGLWYPDDDKDYFAHASSLAFGQFPSYEKEHFTILKEGPQSSIGPGILASPFVFAFSWIDRLTGSDIGAIRTYENITGSWSQFGFVFASCFYFALGVFLLFGALRLFFNERICLYTIVLACLCQGLPLFAYRRPIFSHSFEFFIQSAFVFLFLIIRSKNSPLKLKLKDTLIIGCLSALMYLTRYNNLIMALAWPLLLSINSLKDMKKSSVWKRIAIVYAIVIAAHFLFRVWPSVHNQYQPYAWTTNFLLKPYPFTFYIKRLMHILFGIDWGLLYTAPFIIIGIISAFVLNFERKRSLLFGFAPLVINLYVLIIWRSQGGWYGYRYLIASAVPLTVFPLALLFQKMEKRFKKGFGLLWPLLAVAPFLSMICYEGNHHDLDLAVIKQYFDYTDYGNNLYQLSVWKTFLFQPLEFLTIATKGGVLYLQHLSSLILKGCGLLPNAFHREYGSFNFVALIKTGLLYAIPFLTASLFKKRDPLSLRLSARSLSIFFLSSYGLIFGLYHINKPFAQADMQTPKDPARVLNQMMLRGSDYHYLLDMADKGITPNKRTLTAYKEYFSEAIAFDPTQADAHGLLGFCQYHLGNTDEAIAAYKKAAQLDPDFFWYHYNLGVIFFNNGEYEQSRELMKKALALPPQKTVRSILASQRHYLVMIMQQDSSPQAFLTDQLKKGHEKARATINLCKDLLVDKNIKKEKKLLIEVF